MHDLPISLSVSALTAFVLLYAPGFALIRRRACGLPTSFARIVASTVVTTLIATGLTAAEAFTLRHLLACNAIAAALLLLLRGRVEGARPAAEAGTARDVAGPLLFLVALAVYLPAYPVFLSGSDATAYVSSGVSLARHGTLAREDELGPSLPPEIRSTLFDSMSQVFWAPGPPFRRVPGAMLIESLDARRAWPCFFPVPTVWSAISTLRDGSLRAQQAPDFAPLFAAFAVWAFWLLARQWLGTSWGLAAAVLLGASGPFFTSARMPMSEPIAAFFILSGLAFFVSAERGGRRADALLAGAALGAAIFTRVETAVLLAVAFALLPMFTPSDRRRAALPSVFFAALVSVAALTAVQAAMLPGTYVTPLFDHWRNAWVNYQLHFGQPSHSLIAAAIAGGLALFAIVVRMLGLARTIRWGILVGVIAGQAAASRFLWDRTPMWLSFYIGWSGLVLAAAGGVLAWRRRGAAEVSPFVLALAAAVSLILFYNPHVFPALPWGARRFVPLLLPMLVLLATYAAKSAFARNRPVGLLLAGVLAWQVAGGAWVSWKEPMKEGAWERLLEISNAIPEGGTILVDRELSRLMIAPALWLTLDRNNITVPPIDSILGTQIFHGLVVHLTVIGKGPVYYLTRGAGDHRRPPWLSMTPVSELAVRLRFLENTYDSLPERMTSDVKLLAVYRLAPSMDPKPAIVK